jgi:uncharacterized protein (DUF1684 family)
MKPAGYLPCLLLLLLFGAGCESTRTRTPEKHQAAGPADWLAWQERRRESIAGTNGWTTLIGRYWLEQGRTFAGSAPTNKVKLPPEQAPASVGSFLRNERAVRFEAASDAAVTLNGKPVQSLQLEPDTAATPTVLQVGRLSLFLIERGRRMGVRVRDPEAPARMQFQGLRYFPYDPDWRLEGRFESFNPPRTLRVQDVTGGTQEFVSPGVLVFQRRGTEHRLEVVEEPGEADYFVIFRDRTAGDTTYGAGRFLYVAKPAADKRVVLDFNRAYTPPCGFTSFATCPLPPRQNWLPFEVHAGELKPHN